MPDTIQGTTARERLHSFLNSTFYKPDLEALDIAFAAVRAHFFRGTKPVWLWVVGLSGSGKTEVVMQSLSGLPHVHEMGEITPRALISGKKGQKGILQSLPKVGEQYSGILTWKDFTTFLAMRRDDRNQTMAQIRELGDSAWTKHTGEKGQQSFKGKLSVIAACTHALDIAWSVNKNMGDRFVNVEWRDSDDAECARRAMQHAGHEDEIAATVRSLGKSYFGEPAIALPPPVPSSFEETLVQIATLATWMRRPVHRDEYSHKIDDVPPPEKSTRITKSMRAVLSGHAAMLEREVCQNDLRLAYRLAMDSVPYRRFRVVDVMADDTEYDFTTLRHLSCHARTTLHRELEELDEIGVLTVSKRGDPGQEQTYARLTETFSQKRSSVLCLLMP